MNKVSLNKIRKMQLGGWQQLGDQQTKQLQNIPYYSNNLIFNSVPTVPITPPYKSTISPNYSASQGSLNGNPFKVRLNDQVQQNIKDYQQSTVDAMIKQHQQKLAKLGNIAGTVGKYADMASAFLPQNSTYEGSYGHLAQGIDNLGNTASDVVMQFNPLIGGIMKSGMLLGKGLSAIGLGTDGMTLQDSILNNNVMNATPIGMLNAAFGKRSHNLDINKETEETVGSDYGDTYQDIYKAKQKANKKYGLFSTGARHSANRFIDRMNNYQDVMTGISDNAQRVLAQSTDANIKRFSLGQDGGIKQQYLRVARIGAKLPKVKDKIEWQPVITIDNPIKLEKGGDITIQIAVVKEKPKQEEVKQEEPKNVIPDGALHAHKHHMDNTDSLTQKGIPVVDDKGEQQAEIEKDEIILHLKLTNKLEELQEKYEKASKTEQDKLAIEAGKLLVEEILHNTIDNTNLIDKCKEGGKINGSI